METLTVDELTFEVRRSPRRKTLEITLDRAGDLIIAAPPEVGQERLTDFVREKRFWLYAKMAEKESLQQPLETKEFVSGEGFPYLGRSYRLLLVDDQDVPLKLEAGRFKLLRSLAPQGREHFISWYTDHARTWLQHRLRGWTSRMGLQPKGVDVRDLGFRWGSCGKAGNLNFHWATILLPASVVDYVIVHELAHLREPNHTPEFWRRVERALPEYEQRKSWLAEHGGLHVVL
ncbi:MAG: SprT family zinc-dependent metalloprotease [Chromatiaceae bacterium]